MYGNSALRVNQRKRRSIDLFPDKHTLPTKPEPYNVRYGPRGASEVSVYFS